MNAEREAFEAHCKTFSAHLPNLYHNGKFYEEGTTSVAWEDFHAGFQAGRAALLAEIKAGGPTAEVVNVDWQNQLRFLVNTPLPTGTKLYHLPKGE